MSHSGCSYLNELDSTEILCRTSQLLQNISLKVIIQTEFFVYSVTEMSLGAVSLMSWMMVPDNYLVLFVANAI